MATLEASGPKRAWLARRLRHYLPDLVYGANDGIITTFAVVSGVVGAALSETVILVLGFANLVADGVSMGASNYLARRSDVEQQERTERVDATRHGLATFVGFLIAGLVPLVAYLLPVADASRFPLAIALTALALFVVGAARTFATHRGFLRSGVEMLLVGSVAAVVAYAIGAFAASLTGE